MAVVLEKRKAERDALAQGRVDLAAALRLAVRFGFNEGIDNHFSLMVPGTTDRFLLNPWGFHWDEVRASDLLVVDAAGKLISGSVEPEATAFFIHSRIHLGVPHAKCVLHTHMPYATALTTLANGRIEPISQSAMRFWGHVAYDDQYNGLALDNAEGDRMTAAIGNSRVMFLANHGVVVIGETVAHAFNDLYHLERVCQLQCIAMQTGRPLRRLTAEAIATTTRQIDAELENAGLHFNALKRLLDRDGSDYAE
ncbi:MAG: aldolase [Alphaproteobacteria bacterium]|nr:aldolase [Alphaproteobacteria bacterium]